jgi:type IV pilus assembly protein PilW
MKRHVQRSVRAAGFTLIEILIGLLIGLIGIVVIMQTFAVSEGYKRTATTGSDAQVNGGMALYLVEREVRLAGYGLNQLMSNGCQSVVSYNSTSGTSSSVRFVPFEINPAGVPAGDANTDVILVSYGTADDFVTGIPADQPVGGQAGDYVVSGNWDAFRAGDVVVAYQPGATGPTCVMADITGVNAAAGNCGGASGSPQANLLKHGTSSFQNSYNGCANATPVHNASGGVRDAGGNPVPALSQSAGGMLYNIGGLPVVKVFAVHGGNLTSCNVMTQNCNNVANYTTLVTGIVSLRAVYGQDTDVPIDGRINLWTRNGLGTSANVMSTLAVALEVTAKSTLKEKPSSGTTCDTTTVASRPDKTQDWFGPGLITDSTSAAAQIDLSTSAADWQCYRYKLFQTSVPLRNMIWSPS